MWNGRSRDVCKWKQNLCVDCGIIEILNLINESWQEEIFTGLVSLFLNNLTWGKVFLFRRSLFCWSSENKFSWCIIMRTNIQYTILVFFKVFSQVVELWYNSKVLKFKWFKKLFLYNLNLLIFGDMSALITLNWYDSRMSEI